MFNGELLAFGLPGARNDQPARLIKSCVIPSLILMLDRFKPDVLLVPRGAAKRSPHAQTAVDALVAEAWRRDIAVHAFTDRDVLDAFRDTAGTPAKNKAVVDGLIVDRYPDLRKYRPPHRRNYDPESYYRPLFNAVALYGAYLDLVDTTE